MLPETGQGADDSKRACSTDTDQSADSQVRKFLFTIRVFGFVCLVIFYIDKPTTGRLPVSGTGLASEFSSPLTEQKRQAHTAWLRGKDGQSPQPDSISL